MPVSIITSKGQTTIPKNIRDYLKLHTGDKIDFVIGKEGKVMIEPASLDVTDLKGALYSPDRKPVSVEEMKLAVRKHISLKVKRR